MKKLVAVVPIRKGSQRVKHKNFRPFGGKNLLIHKIETLKKLDALDDIIVNTDSDEAISIAKKLKVKYFRRDDYYASSQCLNSDFWKNVADNTTSEYIMFTNCTSPLIRLSTYENIIKIFNEKEADEIIVLDIEKSTNDNELNYDLIQKFAGECYMPLTYGGGIKNIKQAEKLFSLGIEKLVINSNNYKDINLIDEISAKFGSQSIVSSIDINRDFFNNFYLYDWINKKKLI